MTFRVYSGPRGTPAFAPIEKDKMPYKEFTAFAEAIAWARHLVREGKTVLMIEGDDGTQLTKHDIAAALNYAEDEALKDGRAA